MTDRALDGVVVVELGTRIGVGVCGSLLRELGATVVLVGQLDAQHKDRALLRRQLSAGKLSWVLQPESEDDRQTLRQLVAGCDIVLTSSDVDVALPHIDESSVVVCDVTAFGATGPLAKKGYSDVQVQALSGIVDTTGMPDQPPVPIEVPIVEFMAGTYAAGAALAALRVKRLSGIGQRIDMALYDCAFASLATFMSDIMNNKKSSKSRVGNRHPTVLPWNVFKSADDMVLICAGNQPQWQRLCKVIGRPDLDDASTSTQEGRGARIEEIEVAIEHWTSQLSTSECVRMLSDAGIPGGSLVRIDGHPDEANLEYRKMVQRLFDPVTGRDIFVPGSALRMSVTPGIQPERLPAPDADRDEVKRVATRQKRSAGPSTATRPARPLEGVRVVEIGQYTTAPLAARQLAALGADVIKVEPPGGADGRTWLPVVKGQSVGFRAHNADKQSIVIDLKSEDGKDVLRRLIETADVLVENQKPGTLAKLGFSAQQIAQINPRIVYCAISGFGADSLYASRPAFDMIIQAMSGFMDAVASGTTLKSGISTSDLMGAEMAIVGILAALEYRARSGRGQYLDLSMQDITAWVAQPAWNRDPNGSDAAPLVVACADGYITTEAPRGEIGKALQAANCSPDKFSELDREAAASLLNAVGIAAAPVQTVREGVAHPQTSERRLWFTVNEGGEVWPLFASPLRLLRTPPAVSRPSSNTNEDGPAILEKLGLSQAKARQAVAE